MPVSYWLIAAVLFLVIEIVTLSLASIWFIGGALAGALMAGLGMPLWLQVTAFVVVSIVLLVLIAPVVRSNLKRKRTDTNLDSLIGQACIVTQRIDNLAGAGQVDLKGQIWTARSTSDDMKIQEGSKVFVQSISGVKLIVAPEKKEDYNNV
jgi:membrane protein implicated in regulation of membrane protease activity